MPIRKNPKETIRYLEGHFFSIKHSNKLANIVLVIAIPERDARFAILIACK